MKPLGTGVLIMMRMPSSLHAQRFLLTASIALFLISPARPQTTSYEFNDSHFHLTNNIQEGPDIHDFLKMMGPRTGRVALFGLPLQQQWSYRDDGDRAPKYYLTRTLRSTTTPSQ